MGGRGDCGAAPVPASAPAPASNLLFPLLRSSATIRITRGRIGTPPPSATLVQLEPEPELGIPARSPPGAPSAAAGPPCRDNPSPPRSCYFLLSFFFSFFLRYRTVLIYLFARLIDSFRQKSLVVSKSFLTTSFQLEQSRVYTLVGRPTFGRT